MSNFEKLRSNLLKQKPIAILSSFKLAVLCFLMLSILVIAGTFYQTDHGLYLAQEKFFNSWFVFLGWLPLPSASTVMLILFINLSFALVFRFNYSWKNFGLILNHFGIIALLISGFLTLNFSKESFMKLYERESSKISEDYYKWQVIVKNKSNSEADIFSLDDIKDGEKLNDDLVIAKKYKNARLFETPFAGIILKELPIDSSYENNIPGLVIDGIEDKYLEGESQSFIANDKYSVSLERIKSNLPFTIQLIDVNRDLHPGTEIAKAYSSKILVKEGKLERELTISMNKPYRNGLYTAFQASYGRDEDDNEFTVLAIVKNISYSLPYWATIIASLGLFIYFFQTMTIKTKELNA